MKKTPFLSLLSAATLAALAAGCAANRGASTTSQFIDVHEFGPGKVTAAAVADAHRADLAVESKHGVKILEYWLDEPNGTVYCLSEAKNAQSIIDSHREAHGLVPSRVLPVTSGQAEAALGGKLLYLDIHELGAGKVTAQAVAEAHKKDLAVEGQYGVRFLNYWVDETSGKVLCLSEAPGPDAIRETHRHAHGLLPNQIVQVTKGN